MFFLQIQFLKILFDEKMLTEFGRKKAAESNPFGNFLRRAEKLGQKKAHPSRVCCKQSFITKGFFKRHDKNRGFPSLSLKRANIQLAGIYLADNHIRSPFAFAYIFCWQIVSDSITLLFRFVKWYIEIVRCCLNVAFMIFFDIP